MPKPYYPDKQYRKNCASLDYFIYSQLKACWAIIKDADAPEELKDEYMKKIEMYKQWIE